MKIVQMSSAHHVFDNRIFNKISKSLVNHGYNVDLLIQHTKNEVVEGINIIALPKVSGKLGRPLKVIPALLKKAIEYPPKTIFHFHDPELILVGLLLKIFGYKVIYDVHEDVPRDILSKQWIPKFLRGTVSSFFEELESRIAPKFDGLIVVTPFIKERLNFKNSLLVQNFPIIKEINSIKKNRLGENIFYVGDITLVRGIVEIVDAIDILNRKKGRKIRLKLAGQFSPEILKTEIKKKAGWEFVDFVGWINRRELHQYAQESQAGLVIFHPIESHINAQPNKLFEFMLEGLPIIASDFPLWRKIILDNRCGFLVNPLSAKEIAVALERLIENSDESFEMGKRGRKAVLKKYNWTSQEKKLIALYKSLT
ncbi:MAG: glycosyltransferase [Balneola sp.]